MTDEPKRTPRPDDVQAAYLVERIEAIVPGMAPKYILNSAVNTCQQLLAGGGPPSADDPEHLDRVVNDDRPAGAAQRRSMELTTQLRFSGGGREVTLEQAEAILRVIEESGFCRRD